MGLLLIFLPAAVMDESEVGNWKKLVGFLSGISRKSAVTCRSKKRAVDEWEKGLIKHYDRLGARRGEDIAR